ncbi:hypothetical protein WH47_04121 [Habropoda laboriosa]|uniref:Uncharacterized protein n=1 Tax=Habropoda laboriosa TaxID=597456 RepID=A0A0L7QVE9_9HYME|nr:hypothetical protein WH47_04121 [Habropoda laboriosa]
MAHVPTMILRFHRHSFSRQNQNRNYASTTQRDVSPTESHKINLNNLAVY